MTKQIIQELSVVDLILIDHRFLKECINILTNEDADKRMKLTVAKEFMDAVTLHSSVEKEAIYTPLEKIDELHFKILEAGIEHGIVDEKIKTLRMKVMQARSLRDELEAELKVLADLVKHHLMEEESELLPRMQKVMDEETLREMGVEFMKLRKFSAKDLRDYPHIQDELIQWKDSIQKVSSEFLTKMDKFVENLHH